MKYFVVEGLYNTPFYIYIFIQFHNQILQLATPVYKTFVNICQLCFAQRLQAGCLYESWIALKPSQYLC